MCVCVQQLFTTCLFYMTNNIMYSTIVVVVVVKDKIATMLTTMTDSKDKKTINKLLTLCAILATTKLARCGHS